MRTKDVTSWHGKTGDVVKADIGRKRREQNSSASGRGMSDEGGEKMRERVVSKNKQINWERRGRRN